MVRKRVLMASSNHWESPFQVGSHNLAREFVRAGWDVAYISDPISPLHLCRGLSLDLRCRVSSWWTGGQENLGGRLWSYVPAGWLTPHNKPLLRGDRVQQCWHRWTWPNVCKQVHRRGFGRVDLLYMDSLNQSFWLDNVTFRHAVFRVADYNPHFEKYTPASRLAEEKMAARADIVLYPSRQLAAYAEELGGQRNLLFPNGVDFEHFAQSSLPAPPEFADIPQPIAVYMGVIPEWFHFDWIVHAARELPRASFVLIGPDKLARQRLGEIPNVYLLGTRDYSLVPAYLLHARVGLMPFNVEGNPNGVNVLNPQKMYAYFASGLPVVSASWEEIRRADSPARLCNTADDFVRQLREVFADSGDPQVYREYARRFSWKDRLQTLLHTLNILEPDSREPRRDTRLRA